MNCVAICHRQVAGFSVLETLLPKINRPATDEERAIVLATCINSYICGYRNLQSKFLRGWHVDITDVIFAFATNLSPAKIEKLGFL